MQQQRQQHRILAEISLWPEEFQAAVRQEQLTHKQQTQASLASMQQRLRVVKTQLAGADKVTVEGFQYLSSQVEQLDQTSRRQTSCFVVCQSITDLIEFQWNQ